MTNGSKYKYLKVCRNRYEEFFWDTDDPEDVCPNEAINYLEEQCPYEHDIYIRYDQDYKELEEKAWQYDGLCD